MVEVRRRTGASTAHAIIGGAGRAESGFGLRGGARPSACTGQSEQSRLRARIDLSVQPFINRTVEDGSSVDPFDLAVFRRQADSGLPSNLRREVAREGHFPNMELDGPARAGLWESAIAEKAVPYPRALIRAGESVSQRRVGNR
jgi:hypothetical protein